MAVLRVVVACDAIQCECESDTGTMLASAKRQAPTDCIPTECDAVHLLIAFWLQILPNTANKPTRLNVDTVTAIGKK